MLQYKRIMHHINLWYFFLFSNLHCLSHFFRLRTYKTSIESGRITHPQVASVYNGVSRDLGFYFESKVHKYCCSERAWFTAEISKLSVPLHVQLLLQKSYSFCSRFFKKKKKNREAWRESAHANGKIIYDIRENNSQETKWWFEKKKKQSKNINCKICWKQDSNISNIFQRE